MKECFEEWEEQFKKLEPWNEELMDGDNAYVIWEAFQAGWEAHTNETTKKFKEIYEKLRVNI